MKCLQCLLPLMLLLAISATAADMVDVYSIKLSVDGTSIRVLDKQLVQDYERQYVGDYSYAVKDSSGNTISSGSLPIPRAIIGEEFAADGTIKGNAFPFRGEITVLVPASGTADAVVLSDPDGKQLADIDVSGLSSASGAALDKDLEPASIFLMRFKWLFYVLLFVIGIIALIVLARKIFRRKKK